MPADSPLIGIDLGTTNSLVSVFEDGKPVLVPNALGDWLTPSVVGVLESGDLVCGEAARDLMLLHPERAVATFKRWMGEERNVELGGRTYSPPELSSLVLRSLKADAEAYLGAPVQDAVITVPAYFNEKQRRATQRAGELAGLRVRRILNEPTAAALAYGLQDPDRDAVLLVFDLGGGTFDVTVMEVFEGTLEILSTAGESNLGGEDFTDAILGWAVGETGRALEQAEMTEPRFVARLRSEAERAKRELGDADSTVLRVPDANGDLDSSSPRLELSASLFEERCKRLLDRLRRPLERALRDARKAPGAIDEVLFVGGATRMPLVRRLVTDFFDRAPRADLDPDQVVARGAAVQAALIQDDAAVEDLVMTDVCPFTLGVEITKEFGPHQTGGFFLPVIHRNTTIPVSREELVGTIQDNQTELLVRVFQGESRRVEENLELGELRVTGLPPAPRGLQVAIRFSYDLNGVLEVEAWVPKTGAKFSTVLVRDEELSEEAVLRAVAELQKLKFYPREDAGNQRLLLYAERVLKELDPHQRKVLEAGIDAFEEGLDAGDPDAYERAREALHITLSGLGFPPPGGDNE